LTIILLILPLMLINDIKKRIYSMYNLLTYEVYIYILEKVGNLS